MKKIIFLLIIILFSCKDFGSNPLDPDNDDSENQSSDTGGGDDGGDSSISYTYAEDIHLIFSLNCTGCHGVNGSGALNLLTYDAVISSGSVVSGDVFSSSLYDRITSQGSDKMPPNGSLSIEEIELIEMWINEGIPTEW